MFERRHDEIHWREIALRFGDGAVHYAAQHEQAAAGASGHIGFLHALDASNVWLLSGNSANRVRISAYKRSSLAPGQCFRWPV